MPDKATLSLSSEEDRPALLKIIMMSNALRDNTQSLNNPLAHEVKSRLFEIGPFPFVAILLTFQRAIEYTMGGSSMVGSEVQLRKTLKTYLGVKQYVKHYVAKTAKCHLSSGKKKGIH